MSRQTPNALDRAIAYFAPGVAARRAAFRMFLDNDGGLIGDIKASYRGGLSTRTDTPWATADTKIGMSSIDRAALKNMRDRARRVDRDNPIGNGILNRLVDNVVGKGIMVQARTDSDAFNDEAEDRWIEWVDVADIRGLMTGVEFDRQAYRAHERDGDVGVLLVNEGGRSRLQLIPGDLIKTPEGKLAQGLNGGRLIDGVEINRVGRPIAFWISDGAVNSVSNYTRVAAADMIYFPRLRNGASQVRGETAFAPVFPLLDQMNGYIDAVVIAARMAAVFGLIFREQNAAKVMSGLPSLTNSQGVSQKAVTFENGIVKYIGPSDDVVQVVPQQPMQNTPDFIAAMLRLIGLPFDMPLELVMLDLSQTSFSSVKAGLLQFYRAMRARQHNYKTVVKSRIYRWWISREVNAGAFTNPAPDLYWPHEFQADGWEWVDPVKDLQAKQLELDMGITTEADIAAQLGRDIESIRKRRLAEREAAKAADAPISRSTMTRDEQDGQNQNGNAQGPPPTPGQDEGEGGDGTGGTRRDTA